MKKMNSRYKTSVDQEDSYYTTHTFFNSDSIFLHKSYNISSLKSKMNPSSNAIEENATISEEYFRENEIIEDDDSVIQSNATKFRCIDDSDMYSTPS